jgi:uncharacterized protein
MKQEITYFEKGGEENTDAVMQIAHARYLQGGIDAVVVASSLGKTALKAAEYFEEAGIPLLFVGEVLDGKQSPPAEICNTLMEAGHQVIWGLPMSQMSKFTHDDSAKLVADAYKRISEGFKVVCEIVLIATSAGYLKKGSKVLSIAGTHIGADTAIVTTASGYDDFLQFRVHEILCKPYQR